MRKTIEEIEVNIAYLWFLSYGMNVAFPHFSIFGKNCSRRFKDSVLFEQIFHQVLLEAYHNGFIDEEKLFIDGSHVKANANNRKYNDKVIEKTVRIYEKELQREIMSDRESHEKTIKRSRKRIGTSSSKIKYNRP